MRHLSLCTGVLLVALGAETGAVWQAVVGVAQAPPPPATRDVATIQGRGVRTVPVGTAAISGVVTSAATGRPVANVRLMLAGQSGVPSPARGAAAGAAAVGAGATAVMFLSRMVLSDEQGRYVFDALPAGRFTLTASKDQFVSTAYGAVKPNRPGTTIPLSDGQRITIAMSLARGGVIAGMVYGQDGEPLAGAQVRGFRLAYANGFKRAQGSAFAQTDDRGMYRLTNLMPGDYVVGAVPSSNDLQMAENTLTEARAFAEALEAARQGGRAPTSVTFAVPAPVVSTGPLPGFLSTYYPSASTIATASAITVAAGEERQGADISVTFNRAVNITGLVAGMPAPPAMVQLSLVSDDPMADLGGQGARPQSDGSFSLRNVPPGQYTLVAQVVPGPNFQIINGTVQSTSPPQQIDPASRLWGRARLVVDGNQDPPRVVLTLQPPRSVSGTVEFPPDAPAAGRSAMISLFPAPSAQQVAQFGPPVQAVVSADGQFTIGGVAAGVYSIRAGGGPMKSAMLNGQDLLDVPLVVEGDRDVTGIVITLTNQLSQLSGVLTDATGTASSDCTIIVVAADRRYWTPASRRILTGRPGLDGRYMFNGLPAGDYLVAAVTDIEPGSQFDPDFLNELAGAAVRVTISDGGKQVQDLRIGR
ncbi:MAG: carboxypeptidase regulatory-like domain-containing protein [Acidobacteriota bacterium]